ncbi:hypothetical protein [Longibacter sp.]|uniref:hypothetical protein n=1 Tax=Longibacter sp. TaxID=2045415 RepID=UPI003EBB3FD1
MRIFDDRPVECPPVEVTPLQEDETGQDLLNRLSHLQQQKAEAEHEAAATSQPLPSLIARSDDLSARSMAGTVDVEEAEAAEEEVQRVQAEVEAARRRARQSSKAIALVEKQLEERARTLYEENTRQVRETHRTLVKEARDAQTRAATLLRILREFEMRYARYTESTEPEPYPRYLRDAERTKPPRSLMGPAKSPNGHVYASSDATQWLQRAAALLDENGPSIIDVQALDFESPSATYTPTTSDHVPARSDVSEPGAGSRPRTPAHDEADVPAPANVDPSTSETPEDASDDSAPIDTSGEDADDASDGGQAAADGARSSPGDVSDLQATGRQAKGK